MRQFSLRSILAALALTIQALSAVYASGAPSVGAHGRGDAAYCEAFGGSDRRAPISGHRDAGACLVCQGCLGGFSPFLPLSGALQSPNPAQRRRGGLDSRSDGRAGLRPRPCASGPRAPRLLLTRRRCGQRPAARAIEASPSRRQQGAGRRACRTPIIVEKCRAGLREPSAATYRKRPPEGAGGRE